MSGMIKHVGINAPNQAELRKLESEFIRLGFKGEIVSRSLEQNDCLHKWCRVIRDHLKANGANVTEETVKELILSGLGNTKEIEVPGLGKISVAMRSHKYKQLPSDLSPAEKKAGHISMNELLCKVEAWAATDLNLDLNAEKGDWWEGAA